MLYCRNLFEKSFGLARIVYKDKGDRPKEQPIAQVESKVGVPDIERKKARVKGETREQQAELQQDVEQEQELDEAAQEEVEAKEGTAEDYISSFRKFEKTHEFDVLADNLAGNLELYGADSEFNHKRWSSPQDIYKVADLFEEKFPNRKGKGKLVEGLRSEDQGSKEFLQSINAVDEISKIVDKYVEKKRETKMDTAANVE
ncbi:MAG: hypothetical protein WCT53_04860, partial [Candidatus Gracilibacteria bacterium]